MTKYFLDNEEIPQEIFEKLSPLTKAIIHYLTSKDTKGDLDVEIKK